MTALTRKERERARRHDLIVATARELAEAEGWDAVTTRKLAERIEYSQPVLYSHFKGKDAIMDAVALVGAAEMAVAMGAAREAATTPQAAVKVIAEVYLDFARGKPATFDALFTRPSRLPFGSEAPQPLKDAFAQFYAVFAPLAGDRDPTVFTEVGWSAIHGVAVLDQSGRLPPKDARLRLDILIAQLVAPVPAGRAARR